MLFGDFRVLELCVPPIPLTILLSHVGHGLSRVSLCPGPQLDTLRGGGENSHLIIRGAAAQSNGQKQYRPPHGIIPLRFASSRSLTVECHYSATRGGEHAHIPR